MRYAFAKALRRARKARGLTQEDFALVSSRSYLSSLERGRQSPTLEKVQALARIIGVHPLSLLTLTCLYYDKQPSLEALFDRIRSEIDLPEPEITMIRVLIIDDHALMREGLKQLFALVDDINVAGEATNGDEAIAYVDGGGIDMLLLDMNMPGLSGKDLIAVIRIRHPDLPILVLSMHIEPQIAQGALDAGASGYLTKDLDPDILFAAIRTVARGGRFLDPKLSGRVKFGIGMP